MDQSWSQRVNKLLPVRNLLNFQLPCRRKTSSRRPTLRDSAGLTRFHTRTQWNRHQSSTGSQHSARNAKTRLVTPLSPLSAPKQSVNTRAACRGVIDQAFADPALRKRMIGRSMFEVFSGSGFMAKTANHMGSRGHVLDTKFGARYDVTKPLVLARIRQDVSAGKCFCTTAHRVLFPSLFRQFFC